MIFEICATIATLTLIVLAIFMIRTLAVLRQNLERTRDILTRIDSKIEPISTETLQLVKNSKDLSQLIYDDVHLFSPLMNSIADVGVAIQEAACAIREPLRSRIKHASEEKKEKWQERVSEILELTALGINVWQHINKKRR